MAGNEQRMAAVKSLFRRREVPAERRWALAARAGQRAAEVAGEPIPEAAWAQVFSDHFPTLLAEHEATLAERRQQEQRHQARVGHIAPYTAAMALEEYASPADAAADLTTALVSARFYVSDDPARISACECRGGSHRVHPLGFTRYSDLTWSISETSASGDTACGSEAWG